MDHNRAIYNKSIGHYSSFSLKPPEQVILTKFKAKWSQIRMLDIGVGTGRTSYTFSAITKEYIGIDYMPAFVERCKINSLFKQNSSASFEVQDARDLATFYRSKFDFILFSFNGIDSVGQEDRLKVLHEVRKVLNDDGHFFFSTHSLFSFPFGHSLPQLIILSPSAYYYYLKQLFYQTKLWWINRKVNAGEILKREWAILHEGAHGFKDIMEIYHIKPSYQIQQLQECGFSTVEVYNRQGEIVDPFNDKSAGFFYYLCIPKLN